MRSPSPTRHGHQPQRVGLKRKTIMLDKNSKIYVAGHHGLVGSAIWNNLYNRGYHNLVGRTHRELDLTDQRTSSTRSSPTPSSWQQPS